MQRASGRRFGFPRHPAADSGNGAVIRLNYACVTAASSASFTSMTANRTTEVQFFPGEPVVAPFATFSGASTMSIDRGSGG